MDMAMGMDMGRQEARGNGRNKKRRTEVIALCFLLAVISMGLGLNQIKKQQSKLQVTAGKNTNPGSGLRRITYKGKKYQYNSLITTILYAGVDSTGKLKADKKYSNKERADSISLVVLDKKHKKMTIFALSRDTMTEIRRYSVNGKDLGTYTSHLGYAFSYGDGGEISCKNLKEAVSNLLGGIPINEYVVTNQSSIPYINQLVEGVTVKIPNNDLSELYPEFQNGAVVHLDDSNVTDYLHYRDTSREFSNEGRIQRQEAYITAYIEKFCEKADKDPGAIWNRLDNMGDYILTSITRNKYMELVNLLRTVSFSDQDFYRPTGEDSQGELHDEFYIDREALLEKIVEIFYEEL